MHGFQPRVCGVLIAVIALATIAGCPSSSSKLVQVTGLITVDGKPADGTTLLFFPEAAGDVAAGAADASGKYTLMTNLQPGIAPGRYKVTATWPDPVIQRTAAEYALKGITKDAPDLLKGRYAVRDKSTLSVEITSSTKELPPFALTTK